VSKTADWRPARPDAASADAGAGLREESSFAVEATAIGAQSLIPGVAPIGLADRLAWRAAQPLAPAKPQRPCDCGLFDLNARDQLELFAREEGRR
jgi:hypothetical protein